MYGVLCRLFPKGSGRLVPGLVNHPREYGYRVLLCLLTRTLSIGPNKASPITRNNLDSDAPVGLLDIKETMSSEEVSINIKGQDRLRVVTASIDIGLTQALGWLPHP